MYIGDAISFVLLNRTNGICKDWSMFEVKHSIETAITDRLFCYTEDENDKINGIAWGKMIHGKFYVQTLIAKTKKSLREIVQFYRANFSGVEIVADRRECFKNYKTGRLLALLEKVK